MKPHIALGFAACGLAATAMLQAHPHGQDRFIYEKADQPAVVSPPVASVPLPEPKPAAPQRQRFVPKSKAFVDVQHYVALDRPLEFGEHYWDEYMVRRLGASGPAKIVVDLEAEQLYVYRGGIEIARSKITRGWEQWQTPTGVFPILEKDADHYSSTYDNAPMPYNLRLTWKGVAIHGAEVDDIGATHGCIGVPLEFARKLFANVKVGEEVFITNNWRRDVYG